MLSWLKNSFYILLFLLFVCNCKTAFCQQNDASLLLSGSFQETKYNSRVVTFLQPKSRNVIIRYNPITLLFGGMMYVYQKTISKQIAANCPYEISCSAFSKKVIQKYGLVKGLSLTADRLTRCTRLASFDLDESISLNEDTHLIIDDPDSYKLKDK